MSLPALELLGHATKIAAAALAVALACVQRRNLPLAAVLIWSVMADLGRTWIGETILEPTRTAMRAAGQNPVDVPFTGGARLAFHLDAALFLSWSAGLAVVALAILARRRAWPAIVMWAVASIALAVTYPLTRGEVLRRCYLAAEFAALALTVESVRAWFARLWRERARRVEVPETAALVLPAVEVAILIFGSMAPHFRRLDGRNGRLLRRVRVPLRALLGRNMDTAYVIIMAGVTGAISLVLFTIHLIQGAPHGQDITRIALAMEREAQFITTSQDTLEPLAAPLAFPPLEHRPVGVTHDSPPSSADMTAAAPASTTEISAPSDNDDGATCVTKRPTLLAVLSGRDEWTARGLVDGVWRDLRTLAALASGAEGSTAAEALDVAEHLGPTLEGLAGRLEVALNDLQSYPVPPPLPPPKEPPSS